MAIDQFWSFVMPKPSHNLILDGPDIQVTGLSPSIANADIGQVG